MAKATGPPLPLGNYPNAVDISQPNYAINSVTWLEPPKPFTENHMNTASMTIKTSNDLAYKSVKNATPGIRTSFLATMHMIIVSSSTLSGKDCDKTSQMSWSLSWKVTTTTWSPEVWRFKRNTSDGRKTSPSPTYQHTTRKHSLLIPRTIAVHEDTMMMQTLWTPTTTPPTRNYQQTTTGLQIKANRNTEHPTQKH